MCNFIETIRAVSAGFCKTFTLHLPAKRKHFGMENDSACGGSRLAAVAQ
jgi:hypothetical protein